MVWVFWVSAMLSKIKTYGLIGLGFVATILFALFKSEKAGRAKDKLDGIVTARKIEHEAATQLNEDLERERKENEKAANDIKRDDFS